MQDVKNQVSGLAKASLICGICSIIPFAGGAIGLAAIILGAIDLVKIKNGEAGAAGKKFDITGIVLGVVLPFIITMIMVVTVWGVAAAAMSSTLGG
ncbi:MAG: hypothetical protein H5T85_01510 [Actinobacteria bacterium]|nr:hypothetical protein [Actinomycetota bacterium]